MCMSNRDELMKSYRGPSIDASSKMLLYLAKWFQRKRFLEIEKPKTRIDYIWWPCLLTDQNKISNLNRGPLIDAFCQVSVHLAKQFQRRRYFRNWPTRNKNFLWQPYVYIWNLTYTWSDNPSMTKYASDAKFLISRIPLIGPVTRLGWRYRQKISLEP